jgi:hypothetical protein
MMVNGGVRIAEFGGTAQSCGEREFVAVPICKSEVLSRVGDVKSTRFYEIDFFPLRRRLKCVSVIFTARWGCGVFAREETN